MPYKAIAQVYDYTITSSASAGGSISPAGVETINYGSSQSYTIKPNSGFVLSYVKIDGVPQASTQLNWNLSYESGNHSISAFFVPSTYIITATSGVGGSISPSGDTVENYNSQPTFNFSPNSGYAVSSVSVNGHPLAGQPTSYKFNPMTSNQSISVTFIQNVFTFIATAGSGGTISQSGTNSVARGNSMYYTITPNVGYQIASVTINGVPQKIAGSYAFTNVTQDETINVTFTPYTYSVNATTGPNGTITPSGVTTVNYGSSQNYSVIPNNGYSIGAIAVNGVQLLNLPTQGSYNYTISKVEENETISASFVPSSYVITASAGVGGSISSSGATTVNYKATPSYSFSPNNGYVISSVIVNGHALATQPNSYTFLPVTASQSISVTFTQIAFSFAASANSGGTISPSGTISVQNTSNFTFYIAPDLTHVISSVFINGVAQKVQSSYSFNNFTKNYTVAVTFAPAQYTITAAAGANGTVTPLGATAVNSGSSQGYSIIPDSGYSIGTITVNGVQLTNLPTQGSYNYTISNVQANKTISATFVPSTYYITASAGNYGSISPAGNVKVNYESSQNFTISPNNGYMISGISFNGKAQPIQSSITISNVIANGTINATFVPIPKGGNATYTISASTSGHGMISPAGTTTVSFGSSQGYNFTPDSGYVVGTVTVDGAVRLPTPTNWNFSNVYSNHTINVAFVPDNYVITATAGVGGNISPSGDTIVNYNSTPNFSFSPNSGYIIASVVVNGKALPSLPTNYTFLPVKANQTISVTFQPTFTFTASAGSGGAISPSGTMTVLNSTNFTLYIAPNLGNTIASVLVNGVAQKIQNSYQFYNFTKNYTVAVTFAPVHYTITASTGANGTISPLGATLVNFGSSQGYNINPDNGYSIGAVSINGVQQPNLPSQGGYNYNFNNVQANKSISASFVPKSYLITASAGVGGSISPSGDTTVNYESTPNYNITPNNGYVIANVLINGKPLPTQPTNYTFLPVTSNQSISVTFTQEVFTFTASAGSGGNISPSGTSSASLGSHVVYWVTPNVGYKIASVLINGVNQGITNSYSFIASKNVTMSASFTPITNIISASAGPNGTITPLGQTAVNYGSSQSYNINPNNGYSIGAVSIGGVQQTNLPSQGGYNYNFNNVQANKTISASFVPSSYLITATAGNYGTISPAGDVRVNYESSQNFSISPNNGFIISSIVVDGVSKPIQSSYTISDVASNQSISVTFAPGAVQGDKAKHAVDATLNLQASNLYQLALTTISQYQLTPNNANLTTAIQAVGALQSYNAIIVSATNTAGLYDSALNQLIQTVSSNLTSNNSKSFILPPSQADGSFGSTVAVDGGSVFISAPSLSTSDFGSVYEFKQNSSKTWVLANQIVPNAPNPGDHFGGVFAVKGDTLAVGTEPANGQAQVYIFTRQASGIWAQQDILDLTSLSQLPAYPAFAAIHQISLATSINQYGGYIVVGLPEYGDYMIFDQAFTYSTSTQKLLGSVWQLVLEGSLTTNNKATDVSVAADGDYIVIGSPTNSMIRILQATYSVPSSSGVYLANWSVDPGVSNDIHSANFGFGQSVAIDQIPEPTAVLGVASLPVIPSDTVNQVILAIGSPKQGNGQGAVYTMVKGNPSAKTFVWSSPSQLNLLAPSNYLGIGYVLSLNNNTLTIGANPSTSDIMVYQLNVLNQWAWAYTISAPLGASLATGSGTVAVGQPVPSGKDGTNQVIVVDPCAVTASCN